MTWPNEYDQISLFFIPKDQPLTDDLLELKNKIIYSNEITDYHPHRKEEFIIGRLCAYMAIKKLTGIEYFNIERGADKAPVWPNQIVGSISHSEKWIGCAVALKQNYQSIGIDLETIGRTKTKIKKYILNQHDISTLQDTKEEDILTYIFSAKESLYKALFPLVKKYFGFQNASLTYLNLQEGNFQMKILSELNQNYGPSSKDQISGKIFANNKETCLTLITIEN